MNAGHILTITAAMLLTAALLDAKPEKPDGDTGSKKPTRLVQVTKNGKTVKVISPEGWVSIETYNKQGLIMKRTDPKCRDTLFEHDSNNRVSRVTYPDGAVDEFVYGKGELSGRRSDSQGKLIGLLKRDNGKITCIDPKTKKPLPPEKGPQDWLSDIVERAEKSASEGLKKTM